MSPWAASRELFSRSARFSSSSGYRPPFGRRSPSRRNRNAPYEPRPQSLSDLACRSTARLTPRTSVSSRRRVRSASASLDTASDVRGSPPAQPSAAETSSTSGTVRRAVRRDRCGPSRRALSDSPARPPEGAHRRPSKATCRSLAYARTRRPVHPWPLRASSWRLHASPRNTDGSQRVSWPRRCPRLRSRRSSLPHQAACRSREAP